MNFSKTKLIFLANNLEFLHPDKSFFNNLITCEELSKSWYLTININFRKNILPKGIIDLRTKVSVGNNGSLRIQPKDDLHCSLLNIIEAPLIEELDNKQVIKDFYQKNNKKLKTLINNFTCKEKDFYADFLYTSRESIALQIFIDQSIIQELKELQKAIECLNPDLGNISWKNNIKPHPENGNEDRWGVMNLVRFEREKLNENVSETLNSFIKHYNQNTINERNEVFSIKFKAKPDLVISDHLFSNESEIK